MQTRPLSMQRNMTAITPVSLVRNAKVRLHSVGNANSGCDWELWERAAVAETRVKAVNPTWSWQLLGHATGRRIQTQHPNEMNPRYSLSVPTRSCPGQSRDVSIRLGLYDSLAKASPNSPRSSTPSGSGSPGSPRAILLKKRPWVGPEEAPGVNLLVSSCHIVGEFCNHPASYLPSMTSLTKLFFSYRPPHYSWLQLSMNEPRGISNSELKIGNDCSTIPFRELWYPQEPRLQSYSAAPRTSAWWHYTSENFPGRCLSQIETLPSRPIRLRRR